MIGIGTETYDVAGALRFASARLSNPYESARRGGVIATLDGGCSVYDTGYSVTDLMMRATVKNVSKEMLIALRYLVSHYSRLICSVEFGCFLVVPSFTTQTNTVSLSLRIIDQLD